MKGLMPYVMAGVAIAGVAVAQTTPTPQSAPDIASQTIDDSGPTRLTITVSVADPEDLKVSEGDRIEAGQLIADRTRDRARLETQHQQLTLTLQKLQTATLTAPLQPATVSAVAALPPPSYLEEAAAIEQAKATVDQAEAAIATKHQELSYLSELEHLDPLVLEHEQAQLQQLQHRHTAAIRAYQLAQGKLFQAQADSDYRAYQHSLSLAKRVERANIALSYQRQWAEYEQRLRDREYQIAHTQLRVDEVENEIADIAVVRAPYGGRIRQVKWLRQGADGSLGVELTLLCGTAMAQSTTDEAPLPEMQAFASRSPTA